MKKVLVGMVVLICVIGSTPALGEVDVTVDATFVSKYIWRGFNVYGSHGAFQPSIDVAAENGFSANLWMSYPIGSGNNEDGYSINDDLTEYNYTLAYSGAALEDTMQMNYSVGWRYYDFIKAPTKEGDMQELFVEASMPNLTGNTVVPRAAIYQMWNSKSGGDNSGAAGAIYALGFGYDFTMDQTPDLPMNLSWDIVYNDGTGASSVEHDWSHMVFGLSTEIACPVTNGKIVPAAYWQSSFEDSVNDDDEIWVGVSFSMGF